MDVTERTGGKGATDDLTTPVLEDLGEGAVVVEDVVEGGTGGDSRVEVTSRDGTSGITANQDAEADGGTEELLETLTRGGDGEDGVGEDEGEEGLGEHQVPLGESLAGSNAEVRADSVGGSTKRGTGGDGSDQLGQDVHQTITGGALATAGAHNSDGDGGVEMRTGDGSHAVDGAHQSGGDGESGVGGVGGDAGGDVQANGVDQGESSDELSDQLSQQLILGATKLIGADGAVQDGSTGGTQQLSQSVGEGPSEALVPAGKIGGDGDCGVQASSGDGTRRVSTSDNRETDGETVELVAGVLVGQGGVQNAEDQETGIEQLNPAGINPTEGSNGGNLKGLVEDKRVGSSGGETTDQLAADISDGIGECEVGLAQSNRECDLQHKNQNDTNFNGFE